MKIFLALTLLLAPIQLLAEQYICRSVSHAELTERPRMSFIDFEDTRQWLVDSEQGWREVLPTYQFTGTCESKTAKMNDVKLLECAAYLGTFVINLSAMNFAYTEIFMGNSVTFPIIEASVGKCEKL